MTLPLDTPVCPFCGYPERDAWEIDFGLDEDKTITCGDCGQEYGVQRLVSVSYKSFKPR